MHFRIIVPQNFMEFDKECRRIWPNLPRKMSTLQTTLLVYCKCLSAVAVDAEMMMLMMFQMLTEDNLDPLDLLTYLGPDGPTAADPGSANDADLLSLFS